MPILEKPLTEYLKKRIEETFANCDTSIIKSVLFFDGWSDYEECGGYLIFRGIDDTLQIVDYGYCVMSEDNSNPFLPQDISLERATEKVLKMEEAIRHEEETRGGFLI